MNIHSCSISTHISKVRLPSPFCIWPLHHRYHLPLHLLQGSRKSCCFFVGESCLLRNHCRKRSAAPPLWLPLPNLTFIHSTFSGWGKVKPVLTFSAWCFWFSLVLSDSPQLKDWRKMSIPICVRLVQSSMSEVLASVPGWPGLFHLPVSLLRHGVHSNLPNAPQVQLLYLYSFYICLLFTIFLWKVWVHIDATREDVLFHWTSDGCASRRCCTKASTRKWTKGAIR